jgi:Na+/H+ antiporter NhaC
MKKFIDIIAWLAIIWIAFMAANVVFVFTNDETSIIRMLFAFILTAVSFGLVMSGLLVFYYLISETIIKQYWKYERKEFRKFLRE